MEPQVRKPKGFSLIELLIVVAIILIIAAIAIPNLLRARVSAQEAAAANQVKTLVTAETAYILAYPSCGYVVMTALGGDGTGPTAAGILDNVFPDRDGYHYDINLSGSGGNCGVISGSNFTIEASPLAGYGTERYYFSDPSAQIHFKVGGVATVTDPTIQ